MTPASPTRPDGCRWVRSHLSRYVDQEIDLASAERVSAHLSDCASCRIRHREEIEMVVLAVGALVDAEPDPELPRRLVRATFAAPAPVPAVRRAVRPFRFGPAAAAAIVLGAILLVFAMGPDPSPPAPPPVVATQPDELPPDDPAETADTTILVTRGDVDGDGLVTLSDVDLMGRLIDDRDVVNQHAICEAAGDWDEDGEITPADCSLILNSLYAQRGQGRDADFLAVNPSTHPLGCEMMSCPVDP